jgi:hypothetical protein
MLGNANVSSNQQAVISPWKSLPGRSVDIDRCIGIVHPVARRLNSSITPTASRSRRTTSIAPITAGVLSRRLRAALLAVTEVVAIAALDAAPVARLGTLPRRMTFLIAVAAFHHARLVTLAGQVTLIAAVMASTSAATSHRLTWLSAIGLAMADKTLARHSKILQGDSTYPNSPQLKQA